MKVSLYSNAFDNQGTPIDLLKVIGAIQQGKWMDSIIRLREIDDKDQRDEFKKSLPAATFSGVFHPTRSLANCVEYNNMVVFDIDKLDLQKVEQLMSFFKTDAHILAAWRSPSGTGIKGLVPVSSDKDHHYDAFECVRLYFETNYAVTLDESGKDICRLCFVSYDKDLHYNSKALSMPVEYRQDIRNTVYKDRDLSKKGMSITNDDRVKYEVCRRWAEHYKPYEEGNRNNHIFLCSCNANRTGIEMERTIMLMIADRTDMSVAEIKETVTKVYQKKTDQFNTVTVYDFEQEQEANKEAFEYNDINGMLDEVLSMPLAPPVSTGDKRIDRILGGGLNPGSAYVFVGREGSYKSVYAQMICQLNAEHGVPSVYANGEMSKIQFIRNIIRQQTGEDIMTHRNPATGKFEIPEEMKNEMSAILNERLSNMQVIHDRDFDEASLLSTIESVRKKQGKDVGLLIIDGANHMKSGTHKTEILALIDNAKVVKEIAKKANEGRGVAVIVLIHTDATCKFWDRNPLTKIRGKGGVTRNFDAIFGFSRFVKPGAFENGEDDFELRLDVAHLRVEDRRYSGEVLELVCEINHRLCVLPTDQSADMYEIKPPSARNRF